MRQQKAEAWPHDPAYPYVTLERPNGAEGWPLLFQSLDPGADDGVRLIALWPDSVALRRRVAGLPMKIERPLSDYQGLAVALLDPEGDDEGVAIVLVHADPALSVTLYSAPYIDDVVAEWRGWSEALSLPMLVTEADGTSRPAYPMIGRLTIAGAKTRRPRRGPLKHRRPSVYRRRAAGRPLAGLDVHRGERELIARD